VTTEQILSGEVIGMPKPTDKSMESTMMDQSNQDLARFQYVAAILKTEYLLSNINKMQQRKQQRQRCQEF
jgi:hypothetical protein